MAAKKTVTLMQKASSLGQKPGMHATLIGLGLGRVRSTSTVEDTPSVRGMMTKVRHLIVEEKKG
jgi:large subunit ribosomal protein L30